MIVQNIIKYKKQERNKIKSKMNNKLEVDINKNTILITF